MYYCVIGMETRIIILVLNMHTMNKYLEKWHTQNISSIHMQKNWSSSLCDNTMQRNYSNIEENNVNLINFQMSNEREKWDNGRWAYVRLTVPQPCDMLCWHSACEIHARAHTHITIRMSIIECSRCASCQFCSNNEFDIHRFCFLSDSFGDTRTTSLRN